MARIRFGVIGAGGMGGVHVGYLVKMNTAKLTAVCDIVESRAAAVAKETGAKPFLDYHDLIDSRAVDAVIVATPHLQHPEIAIYAMEHGIHVISEKPLAVTLTPCDKMIATAKKTGCKFAVMFQQRTRNIYQKARQIVQSGTLGEPRRIHYIAPTYRSQAYYDADAWRGTWAGEGGGVLVNQAPHYTDMLWFLTGEPKTVFAKTRTKMHNIEVEDEADTILEYPNGATAYYYTSTTEAPAETYFRIAGDKATLDIQDDKLRLAKLNTPISKFEKTNKDAWARPQCGGKRPIGSTWQDIPFRKDKDPVGHRVIIQNFISAINRGAKLISPGAEGIHQVEISCAIILSSMKSKPVTLPVDRGEYDRLFAKLARSSSYKTGASPPAKPTKVQFFA